MAQNARHTHRAKRIYAHLGIGLVDINVGSQSNCLAAFTLSLPGKRLLSFILSGGTLISAPRRNWWGGQWSGFGWWAPANIATIVWIYIYMFMSIWFPFDKPIAERNAGRSFVIDTCTQHTHPCHAMPYVVCKRMRKCVCVLVVPSVKALVMPDRRANSGGNDGPGHGKSNKMLRQRCTLFAVIRSVVPFFYIIIACFPSSLFSLFTLARILTFHMTWQWKCSRCVRIKWN